MDNKHIAVFGIYPNADAAEKSVDHLLKAGVSNNDVSVLMADTDSTREFAHAKATKAPEGTAVGATAGGVIGGTLGLLTGMEHWRFPELARSLPLDRSLPHWPEWVSAEPLAPWWVRWRV
jgi:hypothetical protein